MADADHGKNGHRRVFGSGVHAGLRLAGIQDTEGFMNNARLKAVEDGLTGIAKKVLDAMAYGEGRSPHQIGSELRRMTGSTPDVSVISGCLLSLKGSGLVRELAGSRYQRINVTHEKPPHVELTVVARSEDEESLPAPEPPIAVQLDLLDRLSAVAGKVRELAAGYNALAQEIEDVALEVESQAQRNGAENARLNQLRTLLRSFAGEVS